MRKRILIQKSHIIRGVAIMSISAILFHVTGRSAYAAYDGIKAAEYAINNVKPEIKGYYNPNYYRADLDCTNFVSQCLEAGGKKRTGTGTGYSDLSVWCPHRTTWENANNFKKYWKNKGITVKSHKITDITSLNEEIYYKFWSGDIMQYSYSDDVSRHSQIVIGQQAYNGKASLRMAQHSNDKKDISLLRYLQETRYKKIKTFKFNSWK